MTRTFSRFLAAIATAAMIAVAPVAEAADSGTPYSSLDEVSGRVVRLALNKSMVIELPEDVRDVLVSSPKVADAVIRSSRKIYLIGMEVGETNVFLFGDGNRQIGQFELVVARDVVGLEATIADVVPGSRVKAQSLGDSIVLSGSVPSTEGAAKAADIAARFIGDPNKVVNSVAIAGSDQVNLRVVIAEVQRNTAKQLGVDFAALGDVGGVTFNPITDNPFGVAGKALSNTALNVFRTDEFAMTIRALQQDGVLKTLAEPNLTAVSGEAASFLVGGEVPTVVGIDENGRITYEFKPYGVSLDFTPVVQSPGRISLKIKTEISEIDNTNPLNVEGGDERISILGFKTRRAETVVELPSGGAIAIGGLIKDDVRQSFSGVPGLMNLPILGALFKSRDFQRQQTELVIFVTPYTVEPVTTSALQRPDQNLNFVSDAQGYFLGQVNRIYRGSGAAPSGTYRGRFGFAYE